MSERMAEMGGQVKQAFAKMKENWNNQEASRKKRLIILVIGLVVLALGLTVVLNLAGGRYVTLYEGMPQEECVEGLAVLQNAGIPGRLNETTGNLEVPSNKMNEAMGQLAVNGLPSSKLNYDIFEKAGGLTTTEFEKRQYSTNQMQDRLQDVIKGLDGVSNAHVTLNLNKDSSRVWDSNSNKETASVQVETVGGVPLAAGQVTGIQHLVSFSVGMAPEDVSVIDSAGNLISSTGTANGQVGELQQVAERLQLESQVEESYKQKVDNILSLNYDRDSYRVEVTATMDYDAMLSELNEYRPQEGTDHGIVNHEEEQGQMGLGQYAEGVAGEENNTDVPTYADLDGDGNPDTVDFSRSTDYLVTFFKEQIEKNGPKLTDASIGVVIKGNLTNEMRETLRSTIAAATGRPIEDITIQSMADVGGEAQPDDAAGNTIFGLPAIFIYIAAGVAALLIIVMILVIVIRNRGKKKRLAEEMALAEAEQEEAERIQREIEERKQQLKDAASGNESDDIITNEVKDFAKNNPEITANLLRTWLREGEG